MICFCVPVLHIKEYKLNKYYSQQPYCNNIEDDESGNE